jgi:anti-sigma B factor antagonist
MAQRDEALGKAFAIDVHPHRETYLLALSGAFGSECRDRFESQIEAARAASPVRVVLDLSGLTFIDSTGLAMVMGASSRLEGEATDVIVVRGHGQVQRVFELTGADGALTVVDDRDEVSAS